MHLTLFQDAYFDGTYIDFDIVIADSMGVAPQTGMVLDTDFSITLYDSAGATDTATITATEIGTSGVYKIRTTYANLNRTALGGTAGDGIWRWIFNILRPDLTFEPMAVSITFNQEIGTATGIPSTTVAIFSGVTDLTTDHYKDSWMSVISGNNKGECKKITASIDSTGNVQLTFGAMSAALIAGDKILIINR